MKEETNINIRDQEVEKYRLVSQWSIHFLSEINKKLESAATVDEGLD